LKGESLLYDQKQTFHLHVVARDPTQQELVIDTFKKFREDFPFINFKVGVESRKVVPWEVVMDIAINVAKGIAVALVVKALEKLWKEIKRNDIAVKLEGLDTVQKKAESYLIEIGVTDFEVVRREDRGLYVFLIFRDHKGVYHYLRVTSFDSRVIDYRRGNE